MKEDRDATLRKINTMLQIASDKQIQSIYRILKYLIYTRPRPRN